MSSQTELLINSFSKFGALINEDLQDVQVFKGNTYTSRKILTVPSGVSHLVFDTTGVVGKTLFVLPPAFTAIGGDRVEVSLHSMVEYTGGTGTEIHVANRSLASSNTSGVVVNYNPTVTDLGVNGSIQWLIPSNAQGGKINSGSGGSSIPFDVTKGFNYSLMIDNKDSNSQTFEYSLTWFEIPDNEVHE
jgi:hypothetical protein